MHHKCYNAHKAFVHIALPYPQEISYIRAYRPHYQLVLKFNNVQTILGKLFLAHKRLLNQFFLLYT